MWLGEEGEGVVYMLDVFGAAMLVCAYLSVLLCSRMAGRGWKVVVYQTVSEVGWCGDEVWLRGPRPGIMSCSPSPSIHLSCGH